MAMRAPMERKKPRTSRIKRRKKRRPKNLRPPRINVCS